MISMSGMPKISIIIRLLGEEVNVEDGTNSFTKRGYVKCFFSSDFQTHLLFGQNLYWIRIEDVANLFSRNASRMPKVHNILLNTVPCINAHTIERSAVFEGCQFFIILIILILIILIE